MRRLSGDDGATAVLVAVLMVALLGMGALVLDVGALFAERRQLQNGADAAALALVPECAVSVCDTGTGTTSRAGAYADANANDGRATVTGVCGSGGGLAACTPATESWDCRPLPGPLTAASFVQVRTKTRRAGNLDVVPPLLARVLDPTYDGTTVRACARASWGPPAPMASLPLTISLCEFQQYTAVGFAPPPPYPADYAGEQTLYFHTNGDDAPPCPAGPSGADLPGGFGWLEAARDCLATPDPSGWFADDPGASPPQECRSSDQLPAMLGQVVDVPVFDRTNGRSGSNGAYHVVGYASFYLTGYVFPGLREKSTLTGAFPCGGSDHCLSGVFTRDLMPSPGSIGTGPDMGATVYELSG